MLVSSDSKSIFALRNWKTVLRSHLNIAWKGNVLWKYWKANKYSKQVSSFIWTRSMFWLEIPEEIQVTIQTLQWRVWSWLRMNASGRPNTCKSNGNMSFGMMTSGARVRNAYATYPLLENSPEKSGLILHNITWPPGRVIKTSVVKDGHAWH